MTVSEYGMGNIPLLCTTTVQALRLPLETVDTAV